jgi:hypothetical protein
VVLCATSVFLWFADRLGGGAQAAGATAIVALLWLIGWLTQARPRRAGGTVAT